jgi:hypothetical protein
MIHVKSHLNHMFPSRGLIKTERYAIKTDSSLFISTSVIKDGSTLSLHVVDPKIEEISKELSKEHQEAAATNHIPASDSKETTQGLNSYLKIYYFKLF